MFGVCLGMVTFWCYLFGSPFTLMINHQPLKWFMEFDWFKRKLAKWGFIFFLGNSLFVYFKNHLKQKDIFNMLWNNDIFLAYFRFILNIFLKYFQNELSAPYYYNKMHPCMSSDFIRFWVNSLVLMNRTQWGCSELSSLMKSY
jgi:hypothetical protein